RTMPACMYCNSEATHQFKNGNWCCSKFVTRCPVNKARNAASQRARDDSWKEKHKQTCKERYGVEHNSQIEDRKRRGAANAFAQPEFKQKMKARYGVENA